MRLKRKNYIKTHQAAHVGGDALPSIDGTEEGGEMVIISTRNVDILIISGN